jgi:hypothetical protein
MSKTSKGYLLGHLFASVKARQEGLSLDDDLAKASFISASRMKVQQRVAEDKSRWIAVRCPRRAGKSWLALSIALERCLRKPNSVWVILGLARPSVQEIFWGTIKQLDQQLELGLQFKEVELSATFGNGSRILFRGAETRSEIEKLRGGQYDGVIIDECKSFVPAVFTELVEAVIEPALRDRRGCIILIGTPGDVLAGPFYIATCEPPVETRGADGLLRHSNHRYGAPPSLDPEGRPIEALWSLHTWTIRDNVECPWLWDEALKQKNVRGWGDDHPTWRRESLGHWVASKDRFVYRYVPTRHDYDGLLPTGRKFTYVLGLDIGYKDSDAIIVWAYSNIDYDVWQVYGDKRPKLNISQLAAWIKDVVDEIGAQPTWMVYDPAGGGNKIVASLAADHGLYFDEPAEKRDKNDFIELMNTEFDSGRLHILASCEKYKDELQENRWLEKTIGTEKRKEDPHTPNDLCDAGLYAWRVCDHRRPQPPDRKPEKDTAEWWRAEKDRQFAEALKEHLRRKQPQETDFSTLDKDWWGHGNAERLYN